MQEVDKMVYSPKEAGIALGLSKGALAQLLRSGKLPSVRAGKRYLIPKTALEEFINGYKEYKRSLGIECNDNDIVFADLQGVPFKADGVSRSFRRLLKQLDITDVRFHDLRTHTRLANAQAEC